MKRLTTLLARSAVCLAALLTGVATTHAAGFTVYQVHTDHLGTPKAMTDTNAQVVWRSDHTPFGRAIENELDNKLAVRFPARSRFWRAPKSDIWNTGGMRT